MSRVAVLVTCLLVGAMAGSPSPLFPTGGSYTWTGVVQTKMATDANGDDVCLQDAVVFPVTIKASANSIWFFNPETAHDSASATTKAGFMSVAVGKWINQDKWNGVFHGTGKSNTTVGTFNITTTMTAGGEASVLRLSMCQGVSNFYVPRDPADGSGASCDSTQICWAGADLRRVDELNYGSIISAADPNHPDTTYCQAFCNRAQAQCQGPYSLHLSYTDCIPQCMQWYAGSVVGAMDQDFVSQTLGYDSPQCRMSFLDAALADNAKCALANVTSPVCTAPASLCDRYCFNLDTLCPGTGTTIKQFNNHAQCMAACQNYTSNLAQPLDESALGHNTLQCRLVSMGMFQVPAIQQDLPLFNKVLCNSAGPTGGANCGIDRTAGWLGVYKPVTGYCNLKTCCCQKGPLNVTKHGPNNLRLNVEVEGSLCPAQRLDLDILYLDASSGSKRAYTVFPYATSFLDMSADLRKNDNEISIAITLLPASCGLYSCKTLGGADCTPAKLPASSSTGTIEFSAAAAVQASPLALLAAALVMAVAKLF